MCYTFEISQIKQLGGIRNMYLQMKEHNNKPHYINPKFISSVRLEHDREFFYWEFYMNNKANYKSIGFKEKDSALKWLEDSLEELQSI